jgi:hypothetical protein
VNGHPEASRGKYFHISGSASAKTATELIVYTHQLVSEIAARVVEHGGGLMLFAGKEPRQNSSDRTSPALLFDWTAMETAAKILKIGALVAGAKPAIVVVVSEKASAEIPAERQQLWQDLLKSGHLRVEYIRPGARSGTMIRDRQAQFGDVLLCVGGGTGVEHLADAYIARRKPVIPLDLSIGASREDGTGGAGRLNREALANPSDFIRLRPERQSMASTLLALLATKGGKAVSRRVLELDSEDANGHLRCRSVEYVGLGRGQHDRNFPLAFYCVLPGEGLAVTAMAIGLVKQ